MTFDARWQRRSSKGLVPFFPPQGAMGSSSARCRLFFIGFLTFDSLRLYAQLRLSGLRQADRLRQERWFPSLLSGLLRYKIPLCPFLTHASGACNIFEKSPSRGFVFSVSLWLALDCRCCMYPAFCSLQSHQFVVTAGFYLVWFGLPRKREGKGKEKGNGRQEE